MQPIDIATLDAHREPLRRLAAALLGDSHDAEDVVQDAFAAALRRAAKPELPPTWLRAVVRRLALDRRRRAARRSSRESAVARPEAFEETTSVERLELVEALAREVRGLDEPYRTAVRLRYFDGLAPAEIARTTGITIATVESRLVRARELLRERLDRRGGRNRWMSAALAWTRPATIPWMEIVLVKSFVKVALAVGLLGMAWFGWHGLRGEAREPVTSAPANVGGQPTANGVAPLAPMGDERIPVAGAVAPASSPLPPASTPQVAGIVLDTEGRPVAGVEVGFMAEGESVVRAQPRARSGADGRFALDDPQVSGTLRATGKDWFTCGAPPVGVNALPCERVVCVATRSPLAGVVVDGGGVPLEGVRVDLTVSAPRFPGLATDFVNSSQRVVSATNGAYRFDDAPLGGASVRASRRGSALEVYARLEEVRAADGRIVFTYREQLFMVHGRVVDPQEQPVEGAFVDVGAKGHQQRRERGGLRSDARGEFEFPIQRGQAEVVVTAAARGFQAVTFEPPTDPTRAESWPEPLVLRLERPALSIRGRVIDLHGGPLPAAWIDIVDGTPWGYLQKDDDPLEPWAEYTWETLASARRWPEHVNVDSDGHFVLGELAPRSYRLLAFDARTLHWTLSDPIAAGTEEVVLSIDTSSLRDSVAGRVVDTSGAPVPGAHVSLSATAPLQIRASGETADFGVPSVARITDAAGRFEFPNVSFDADYVSAKAPRASWFSGYAFLSEFQDATEVVVVLPRVTFVQVEIAEGTLDQAMAPTDVLGVDARDMWLSGEVGGASTRGTFNGTNRTSVFPIGDTARFLIVRHGGENVLRIPVELEPGKVNLIRR